MTAPTPARRPSCRGPLALTLGVVLAVALATVLPWRAQLAAYQEAAADQAAQLQRFQARLLRRPGIERALDRLESRAGLPGAYIQGQTLGLAGAGLQQLTKELVEGAGGTLISSQIATPPADPPLQMLVNRVRMRGDSGALLRLAHRVESGEPVLFLENLMVRAARAQRRAPEELDIQFDLTGYMRLPEDAP